MGSKRSFEVSSNCRSTEMSNSGASTVQLRPLYILPLFANVIIIVSVSALCEFLSTEIYDESQVPLPHWVFFASSVVFAPTMIALCKVLPNPSHSLLIGGLISTAGLLSAVFITGYKQMVIFAILVGVGVTLSLTSTSITVAPYFVQRSKKSAVMIIVSSALIMASVHSAVVNLISALGHKTFAVLCPIVLITSAVPIGTKAWFERTNRAEHSRRSLPYDDPPLYAQDVESASALDDKAHDDSARPTPTADKTDSVCQCIKQRFRSMTFQDGWLVSIISVIVWLFWGAGVDTTWYSMLLAPHTDAPWLASISDTPSSFGQNVILIQLLLSMAVLAIKMITEPKTPALSSSSKSSLFSSQPVGRLVFGCNYMFLGLLGVGGLLVAFCPDYTVPFHNHLLFSIGFALQFDDLCDLRAEDDDNDDDVTTDSENGAPKHSRLIYGITLKQLDRLEPKRSSLEICCLICHLLSLFMMSCLAMLLGLQVSNGLIFVLTKSPVAYLFSSGGLVFVSTMSIVLSLSQPDTWL